MLTKYIQYIQVHLFFLHVFPSLYRYEKCHMCFSHLVILRQEAERAVTESSRAARVIRDSGVLNSFSVLD